MTLRKKTITGLTWSFIDNFSKNGLLFIIGIILARLLTPREFGIIGMTTFFIALSQTFVESGLNNALIRKKKCTQIDYSTVFVFNLALSIIFYIMLNLSAGAISVFFNEPKLKIILQVLGISIIIHAFTIVQRTILTRKINFKLQTKISFLSTIISGIIAIIFAFLGFGVWSLVVKTLSYAAFHSIFLWIWNKWKPSLAFSMKSFREMFSFGFKLLVTNLLNTAYLNIYTVVIGKYFSTTDLGFFTRAKKFKKLPADNITKVIQRVTYPVLASIQDNPVRLKNAYRKALKSTVFITFPAMITLAVIAQPLIIILIGDKWAQSIPYLQILCFAGLWYPIHALNLNMLLVKGRSDLYLRLSIVRKLIVVPIIIVSIQWGIIALLYGLVLQSTIAYFINSYYSGKLIGYPVSEQVKDISVPLILSIFTGATVLFVSNYFIENNILKLIIESALMLVVYSSLSSLFNKEITNDFKTYLVGFFCKVRLPLMGTLFREQKLKS